MESPHLDGTLIRKAKPRAVQHAASKGKKRERPASSAAASCTSPEKPRPPPRVRQVAAPKNKRVREPEPESESESETEKCCCTDSSQQPLKEGQGASEVDLKGLEQCMWMQNLAPAAYHMGRSDVT